MAKACQSHAFVDGAVRGAAFVAVLECGNCRMTIVSQYTSGLEFQTAALSGRLVHCGHCGAFATVSPPIAPTKK